MFAFTLCRNIKFYQMSSGEIIKETGLKGNNSFYRIIRADKKSFERKII